jgi:hypothetical protein
MKKSILFALQIVILVSCHNKIPDNYTESAENVTIYPDYTSLTIPYNIAPLNFIIDPDADGYMTKVYSAKKEEGITVKGKEVLLDTDQWEDFLFENRGDTIFFQIFLKKKDKWIKYPLIKNYVASESIDNYLAYRLIQPLFVTYHELLIQQRNITCFNEKTVFNTRLTLNETGGQCINCHSFQDYNRTGKIQIHFRGKYAGTLITKDNKLEKFNLKTDSTITGGVYPSWHPSLNLIAYSVNKIHQNFHTKNKEKTEVQDNESGLILFNIEKNEVTKITDRPDVLETFPYWAPDGKFLYFSSADYVSKLDNVSADLALNYKNIKYNLMRISFDTQTLEFGEIDTVFDAAAIGKSATFPRVSPDGKYLLFTMGDYGNFHIWHKSSDLYLMDVKTGETRNLVEINSPETESYHSWSSNGCWIVFSSRRQDGAYTRFYISYFDGKGNFHKPFILPQKDPQFYQQFFRSFNIPEFLTKPIDFTPHEFVKAIKKSSKNAVFSNSF